MKTTHDLSIVLQRVAIGVPMLFYGISKSFNGIDFITNLLHEKGLPTFLGYGVYAGELIAPLLLIIGFRSRLAAIVFAINCLAAILLAQTNSIFMMNENGGWALELLAIYTLIALSIAITGSGKFAISSQNKWD